ncbi:hypothetical protein PHAVU_004G075600 [Phaseolus vulgaris]
MKEADIEKRNLQSLKSKMKYDLRKSLAWDSAFSTNSGILDLEELFSTSNSSHTEKGCDMLRPKQDQHLYFNNLKPEIKTAATDGFNLRKSLAWDSAFFTSEGILNHEELSLLNKGLKKSEMGMLPQIEELGISSESNRSIESDASCCTNIQKAFSTARMDGDSVPKLKTGSRYNDSNSCTTLSGEFSSLSSQSHMNASSNGLCSPYKRFSIWQSSPEFSLNFCCISPSVSTDGFFPASSLTESIGSHDGNGIMCSNTFSEVKESNYVSFDASRTVKPSGLRMPSPNIGYFDMNNLLVSIENRDNKSHSRAISKIKSGQMLEDVRNTRTSTWKTRNINNSRIMKFGHSAVSTTGEGKDCLTKDEKMMNARAHEHAFERKTCAKVDKRGVGNKILREKRTIYPKQQGFGRKNTSGQTLCTQEMMHKLHESVK